MSEISDGYGDLSPVEAVENFRRWTHTVATSYAPTWDARYDDLVQEALIQIWKVTQNRGGNVNTTYLTTAARHRMNEIASGRPMTGGDSTPGPKSRPAEVRTGWDQADQDFYESLLVAPDLLASIDWAYHAGEIAQALNALPAADRDYVVQRFWGGKTDTEIAAETGRTNKFWGARWTRQIRPVLIEALAHLAVA